MQLEGPGQKRLEKQALGRWGESVAAEYLKNRGYEILARNVRTPYGELDLVTRKLGVMVFVEVKTRSGGAYGVPEEAVTAVKQAHLRDSAQHYLQCNPDLDGDWRIDVIAIQGRPDAAGTRIEWFENAVT